LKKKSAKFDTWKGISGDCVRCGRYWSFQGWDNSKEYRLLASRKVARLCTLCIDARKIGEYRFSCEGCSTSIVGSFQEVRELMNVFGRAFCRECKVGFFGRYDPENPALCDVMAARDSRVRRRHGITRYVDDPQQLFEQEMRYSATVRQMSRTNLRRYADVLNPNGHRLGRSGAAGAYQLDHIVPVSMCWEYRVAEDRASSLHNLQVVPWFVNLSRGNNISLESLVGWPFPAKRRGRRVEICVAPVAVD
jgi:hypothetical protein